jgi:multidrug resistance efflux pump
VAQIEPSELTASRAAVHGFAAAATSQNECATWTAPGGAGCAWLNLMQKLPLLRDPRRHEAPEPGGGLGLRVEPVLGKAADAPKVPTSPSAPAATATPTTPSTGWLLECLAVVLQAPSAQAGVARSLVAHLASRLRCQRVGLGWFSRSNTFDVQALSDLPQLGDAPDAVRDMQAAMHECSQNAATVCVPRQSHTAVHSSTAAPLAQPSLAHLQLARASGASVVCSVPLSVRGVVRGVLTLARDSGEPFAPQDIKRLEQLAAFVAPLLQLRQAAPQLDFSSTDKASQRWQQLRRFAPALALATLLLVGLVPVEHAVLTQARVHGLTERHLTAPRDGFIASVAARPGDSISTGQVLLTLDEEGPRNELKAAQATLEQAEASFGEALSRGDQSQVVTQVARADEARARVAVLTDELMRGRVQAPAAGSVVEGDLTRSIGAPVKRGDTLMVVAPDQGFRLVLWVDERDVERVAVGQPGSLRLAALPGQALPLTVQRITPVASVREGHNGFELEAALAATGAAPALPLKPGFEGVARLQAGDAPLAWVLGQRAVHTLRVTWWSWFGV